MSFEEKRLQNLIECLKDIYGDISTTKEENRTLACDGWIKRYNEIITKIKEINKDNQEITKLLNEDFKQISLTGSTMQNPKKWGEAVQQSVILRSKIKELVRYFPSEEISQETILPLLNTRLSNDVPYMVFISYSTKDLEVVNLVRQILEAEGVNVFVAEHDVQAGQQLNDVIKSNLQRSELFIVFITKNSIASQYVQQEIGFAQANNKAILPIVVEPDVKPSGFISEIKYLDYKNNPQVALVKIKEIIKDLKTKKKSAQIIGWGILLGLGYLALKE